MTQFQIVQQMWDTMLTYLAVCSVVYCATHLVTTTTAHTVVCTVSNFDTTAIACTNLK